MRNLYQLASRWRIAADRERVWDGLEQLLDSADPMVWWPSVQTESYCDGNLNVRARSHLGYSLTFRLHDLVTQRPSGMTVSSDGDLRGSGVLTFVAVSDRESAIEIQWNVSTDRAWMRATSWLLRPLFGLGHHVVMRQGEKNFNAWLAMRGTASRPDR